MCLQNLENLEFGNHCAIGPRLGSQHFLGFEEYFDRDSGWKRDIFALLL